MNQEDHEYYAACKAYEKLELRQNDERLGSAVEYVIGKMAYEQYYQDMNGPVESYTAREIADYEWSRYN